MKQQSTGSNDDGNETADNNSRQQQLWHWQHCSTVSSAIKNTSALATPAHHSSLPPACSCATCDDGDGSTQQVQIRQEEDGANPADGNSCIADLCN